MLGLANTLIYALSFDIPLLLLMLCSTPSYTGCVQRDLHCTWSGVVQSTCLRSEIGFLQWRFTGRSGKYISRVVHFFTASRVWESEQWCSIHQISSCRNENVVNSRSNYWYIRSTSLGGSIPLWMLKLLYPCSTTACFSFCVLDQRIIWGLSVFMLSTHCSWSLSLLFNWRKQFPSWLRWHIANIVVFFAVSNFDVQFAGRLWHPWRLAGRCLF